MEVQSKKKRRKKERVHWKNKEMDMGKKSEVGIERGRQTDGNSKNIHKG